jgi:hypothetical protein
LRAGGRYKRENRVCRNSRWDLAADYQTYTFSAQSHLSQATRCNRQCKIFGPNRTKTFHVKHFGKIDPRKRAADHELFANPAAFVSAFSCYTGGRFRAAGSRPMPDPVITRFAPSPAGFLHIGGACTALFN